MLTIAATRVLVGTLLLTLGRRLYWLFVGAVGFVLGMQFSEQFLQKQPEDVTIMFALVVGLVCAVLAVAVRKAAVSAAGFLAGGWLLTQALAVSGQQDAIFTSNAGQLAPWITFLVGGVLGAMLMNVLFNWTLVVLSAMGGAALVCKSVHGTPQLISGVYTVLVILGVLIQAGMFSRRRREGA